MGLMCKPKGWKNYNLGPVKDYRESTPIKDMNHKELQEEYRKAMIGAIPNIDRYILEALKNKRVCK